MYSQQRKNLTRGISELQSVSDTLRHGKLYSTCGFIRRLSKGLGPSPTTCQWIEGHPTKAEYRKYGVENFKCGAAVKPKSSYCEHHHQIAYVPLTKPSQGPASENE